jgi:hypothetical protein
MAVLVAAFLLIPVAQAAAAESIKVSLAGSGSGEVKEVTAFSIGEPPIACEPTCESTTEFEYWALAAIPAEGSTFAGWSFKAGGPYFLCEGGEEEEEFVKELKEFFPEEFGKAEGACFASSATSVELTATFTAPEPKGPPLTLNVEEGEGTVVSNPAGLSCTKAAPGSCTTEEVEAGPVTLTASPAPGYLFKSWKGCSSTNGRQCSITLAEPGATVGVKFVKALSLEGTKSISNGILNTSPGGVNCGFGCLSSSALYKEGSVTVKTKPAKHFHFVEFDNGTGSASSCTGSKEATCTFTLSSNSSIEEVYAEDAKNTLSLSKTGGGQGSVKSKPTAINCGYTCSAAEAEFFANEEVPITVVLNKGTTSVTWTTSAGTCTGNTLTCTVPMSSAKTLVAKFD